MIDVDWRNRGITCCFSSALLCFFRDEMKSFEGWLENAKHRLFWPADWDLVSQVNLSYGYELYASAMAQAVLEASKSPMEFNKCESEPYRILVEQVALMMLEGPSKLSSRRSYKDEKAASACYALRHLSLHLLDNDRTRAMRKFEYARMDYEEVTSRLLPGCNLYAEAPNRLAQIALEALTFNTL